MYLNDKINKGGEIKQQGDFFNEGQPFYVFVMPITEEAASSVVINAKLSYNKEAIEFPFIANFWNPVVVNSINITQEILTNYRVFYGMEG